MATTTPVSRPPGGTEAPPQGGPPAYPLRIQAWPDEPLSRWLWLVKWLLAVPHFLVVALLWVAVVAVSIVAFFAILFTGRYPRSLFDFTVGVMRWTWRVQYYTYGALATDRYPPFTLADVPDYPAHLEVDYPEHLSRGLVLVKWWLLALPQYAIVGILSGGTWTYKSDQTNHVQWGGGLIALLVFIAAVVLLFTGRYPRSLYDLLVGLNRWVLRVSAYGLLLTDVYPPFRLDQGGADPPGPARLAASVGPPTAPAGAPATPYGPPPTTPPAAPGPSAPGPSAPGSSGPGPDTAQAMAAPGPPGATTRPPYRYGWTSGRVVAVVLGVLLGLLALGPVGAGVTGLFADRSLREGGFLTTSSTVLATPSSAIVADGIDLGGAGPVDPSSVIGEVRVRVRSADSSVPVFIGVTSEAAARSYLAGTAYARVVGPGWRLQEVGGSGTLAPPVTAGTWAKAVTGYGQQELRWSPEPGRWAILVANADGAAVVAVTADVGATLPHLAALSVVSLIVGLLMLAAAAAIVAVAAVRAGRRPVAGAGQPGTGGVAQPPRV